MSKEFANNIVSQNVVDFQTTREGRADTWKALVAAQHTLWGRIGNRICGKVWDPPFDSTGLMEWYPSFTLTKEGTGTDNKHLTIFFCGFEAEIEIRLFEVGSTSSVGLWSVTLSNQITVFTEKIDIDDGMHFLDFDVSNVSEEGYIEQIHVYEWANLKDSDLPDGS